MFSISSCFFLEILAKLYVGAHLPPKELALPLMGNRGSAPACTVRSDEQNATCRRGQSSRGGRGSLGLMSWSRAGVVPGLMSCGGGGAAP